MAVRAHMADKWMVIRLNAMGDVALSTGVLPHWKSEYGIELSVVTREAWAPLFQGNPAVNEVVGLTDEELGSWTRTARRLAKKYDDYGLIDLHGVFRARVLATFWRGPVVRYKKMSLQRRLFALTRNPNALERLLRCNVPQRYALALDSHPPMREKVRPRLFIRQDELAEARAKVKAVTQGGANVVSLHPFATHESKQWPAAYWKWLIRLLEEHDWSWVMLGRGDTGFLDDIEQDPRNMVNLFSLRESAAVIAASNALVTADSGPMHLATGVGTPAVALFGPTHQAWGFYPSGERDVVLEGEAMCRPCSLHGKRACGKGRLCMESIEPIQVLGAIQGCAAHMSL